MKTRCNVSCLSDVQTNSADQQYADRQRYHRKCRATARKGGSPPPPPPPPPYTDKITQDIQVSKDLRTRDKAETICPDCGNTFRVLKTSIRKAQKNGRECRCVDCNRKRQSEKAIEFSRKRRGL